MTANLDALVTTDQMARLLGVRADLVRRWAHRYPERLPVCGRDGHRPKYRYGDGVELELATRRSGKSTRG